MENNDSFPPQPCDAGNRSSSPTNSWETLSSAETPSYFSDTGSLQDNLPFQRPKTRIRKQIEAREHCARQRWIDNLSSETVNIATPRPSSSSKLPPIGPGFTDGDNFVPDPWYSTMYSPEPLAPSREAVRLITDVVGKGKTHWQFYWFTNENVRSFRAEADVDVEYMGRLKRMKSWECIPGYDRQREMEEKEWEWEWEEKEKEKEKEKDTVTDSEEWAKLEY